MSEESEHFPWLKDLPEKEQRQFWLELEEQLYAQKVFHGPPEDFVRTFMQTIHEWKATAEAHVYGLPEILASAEPGDFGEVPRPEAPYEPKHPVRAVVRCSDMRRYQIEKIHNGHYLLRALFSSTDPTYVWWKCEAADRNVKLEHVPRRYGLIKDATLYVRKLTADEMKERGLTDD